jgi:hypothetical protein
VPLRRKARAVPLRRKRNGTRAGGPRGRRPAKPIKVYTWFAHWCAGGRKVCSKFTCQYAKEESKFTLMPNKFTSEDTKQPKKFTLMQKKFTLKQKKVYIFDEKVYIIYQKIAKKFIQSKPV